MSEHAEPGSAIGTGGPAPAGREAAVELVRSEERLRASVEWVSAERVRISKRIVTETRTLTVQVRREELVVERFPTGNDPAGNDPVADATSGGDTAGPPVEGSGGAPVVELVLHEEVPEVTVRSVPTEWVLVYKDTVTDQTTVDASLRREEIELVEPATG